MNICIFVGNLTADPEVRIIQGKNGEVAVCSFRIGVNDPIDKSVTFPLCEAWGKGAEIIQQYFKKGDLIRVYTKLRTDSWEDQKTGQRRYRDKYRVDRFEFPEQRSKNRQQADTDVENEPEPEPEPEPTPRVTNRRGRDNGKSTPAPAPVRERRRRPEPEPESDVDDDDEIPF